MDDFRCDICGGYMKEPLYAVMSQDKLQNAVCIRCCSKKCFGSAFARAWAMDDFGIDYAADGAKTIEALKRKLLRWLKK